MMKQPMKALDKLKGIRNTRVAAHGRGTKFVEGHKNSMLMLEGAFVFSVVWTFGGILVTTEDKAGFDMFIRERLLVEHI
jgi:hypothetical protein